MSHDTHDTYNTEALASELSEYLRAIEPTAQDTGKHILYKHVVSFKDGQARTNWKNHMPDAKERSIFREFFRVGGLSRDVRIALLVGPNRNWITNSSTEHWDDMTWHCQAIAWIKGPVDEPRPHLVIFDPLPEHATPVMEISIVVKKLAGLFYKWVSKDRNPIVWYSTSLRFNEEEQCLAGCLERIKEWVAVGDQVYQGEDDPRMAECVRLEYK